MPELPDITVYVEKLNELVKGKPIEGIRVESFFLLRTAQPPLFSIYGKEVKSVQRMGKRIVFEFPEEYYLIFHLMIAGRLHWRIKGAAIPRSNGLAAFDFSNGALILTETGTQKRASLHLIWGKEKKEALDPGGLEVFDSSLEEFKARLTMENHTLKRALTDSSLFSGIGNTYSDEILHRAKLSPILLTKNIDDFGIKKLFESTKEVLAEWTARLRKEAENGFPEHVTAFREEMAVHGQFGKPCPVCGTTIQRIQYASNETDYCPLCQTDGKLLADRALSRLLKKDWPTTAEEWEEKKRSLSF
jgi:formamidopyrimidine-DNA glycosylase